MGHGSRVPGYEAEAEFYDLTWESLGVDVDFYRGALKGADSVLDCMCGTGRVAIALARDGHRVDGIDSSPAMLRKARQKAQREDHAVRRRLHWHLGDLARADLGKEHDAALVALNSYGLILSKDRRIAALRRIRTALRPRGGMWLAMDSVRSYREVDEGVPTVASSRPLGASGDIYVRVLAESGSRSQHVRSVTLHVVIDRKGKVKRSQLTQTVTAVLPPSTVRGELRHAGFRPTRLLGGYDGRPYSPSAASFIVEAVAR